MPINLSSCKKSICSIFKVYTFFSITLLTLLTSERAFAQGELRFFGLAVKEKKALSGATVSLYREDAKISEAVAVTGKNGKFKFSIEIGYKYEITFSYPGCVDMFMVLDLRVPPDKKNLYPDFSITVPFFEASNQTINLYKFQQPFAKIIFDGEKKFYDDPDYNFKQGLFVIPAEKEKALAEKMAKEKAEKERLAAEKEEEEAREKAEKERMLSEKARKEEEEEEKLLAEQKSYEEAKAREEFLLKLKEEEEKEKALLEKKNEKMDTEGFYLQQEKEAKAILEKKNKSIKSMYENDLLKLVAESERIEKGKAFKKLRIEAEANSVIEVLRKEAELKAKASYLREQDRKEDKKTLVNAQIKAQQMKRLIEEAAFSTRSLKISNQSQFPDVKNYKMKEKVMVVVSVDEEFLKTIKTTTITLGRKTDTYRKETYIWGVEYYYKNNVEIDNTVYLKAILTNKEL